MEDEFAPIYEMKPLGIFLGPFGDSPTTIDLKVNINVLQKGKVNKIDDLKLKRKMPREEELKEDFEDDV